LSLRLLISGRFIEAAELHWYSLGLSSALFDVQAALDRLLCTVRRDSSYQWSPNSPEQKIAFPAHLVVITSNYVSLSNATDSCCGWKEYTVMCNVALKLLGHIKTIE
jgi:hypothetical protein